MKPKPAPIILTIENDVVSCDWWTEEVGELFCSICSKKDTEQCDKMTCTNANPWCG